MRWLSRFSFSLLAIGAVLFYQAYLGAGGRGEPLPQWKIVLLLAGGVCAVSLGLRGIRERHRRNAD